MTGNVAYADGSSGLQLIDVSNPTNPTLQARVMTRQAIHGVGCQREFRPIANYESGLWHRGYKQPSTPILRVAMTHRVRAFGVDVVNNFAYVADETLVYRLLM